jgi:hypothetical protein
MTAFLPNRRVVTRSLLLGLPALALASRSGGAATIPGSD